MRLRTISGVILVLTILPLCAQAQSLWTGILAPSRAANWSDSGVSGGIPDANWTQCGSTIGPYGTSGSPASPSTIQNAINSCSANHYVQLGAGNFYLNAGFHIQGQSHIAIRGMGANSTFIYFYGQDNCAGLGAGICIESGDVNWVQGMSNGPVSWSAGYSQGTTVITLASVPNLKIGNPIILDQQTTPTDSGSVLEADATTGSHPFTSPGNAGPYSAQGSSLINGRDQVHVYKVVGCNGSTTQGTSCSGTNVAVTVDPPIEEANWTSSLSPQAWWATNPAVYDGIENLSIDDTNSGCGAGNGTGIGFFNTVDSWESGVRDDNECRVHTWLQYSTHATIRNNYMFLGRYSSSTSYGFECFLASDSVIENNIIQAVAGGVVFNEGCTGLVVGYNFDINGYYTQASGFVIPMGNLHAVNNDYNLIEGNVGARFDGDIIHGTHNLNTLFRNRFAGTQVACYQSQTGSGTYAAYLSTVYGSCTGGTIAINDYANNRFYNIIGNVLGTSGITANYENTSGATEQDGYVLNIGVGDDHNGATVPNDPTVPQTLMLWGNCDDVHGFSASNCQFNSSGIPVSANLTASQQNWANTVPSSHTLPASFYYSSKPSWWPSSKAWPAIGPDVTGGNISGTGGLAYTIPAQDCYNSLQGSTNNGSGGPFPFDASTCYGSGSSNQQPPESAGSLGAKVN